MDTILISLKLYRDYAYPGLVREPGFQAEF